MKTVAAIALALVFSCAGLASAQVADELSRRQAIRHYRAGQELLTAERYEQAAAEFARATELDPLLTLAHYGLGQSYMALKRYASAIQAFIGCRDAYGELAALRQRDVIASDRLQTEEIQELRESIMRVRTGQIKGAGPAMLQRLEARLEDLERTRTTNVGRLQIPAEVSLALGSAYYRNGQREDAEREWLAAVRVNSSFGEAHNNLAALYLMTGRKKEAEEAVRAAERVRFPVHPQMKADISKMGN